MTYSITKHTYSIDVFRNSDNHACSFPCANVFFEQDTLYCDAEVVDGVTVREADTLPEGKNFGDVKNAGRGWVQEDLNWDDELNRVFGEVDADLKKEFKDYFTTDMKAKYLAFMKGE